MAKKKRHPLRTIIFSFLWVIVALCAAISLTMTIDRYTNYHAAIAGHRLATISSQSMSYFNTANEEQLEGCGPHIYKGDCVIAKTVDSIEDVQYLDIVIYVNSDGQLVCHRVVSIDVENNSVVTRGDTNTSVDGSISFSAIRGVVTNVIPKVGHVTLFLQSYYGLLAISGSVFFIVLGLLIFKLLQNKTDENEKPKAIEEVVVSEDGLITVNLVNKPHKRNIKVYDFRDAKTKEREF